MSDASMTPFAYLIPRTDVPVTIGLRVRSLASCNAEDEVDDEPRAAPPDERLRDMLIIRRKSAKEAEGEDRMMMNDLILEKSLCSFRN